jgi:hypothetical protein
MVYKCRTYEGNLQFELIDLQCNSVLKSKFDTVGVPEIFKYLVNSYPKLKKHFSNIHIILIHVR